MMSQQQRQKNYTILVIDDNTTNLKVITDYITQMGFKVLMARSGESGLKRARLSRPDLILLDVLMPGMNGFEVCQHLKADEQTEDIPIIFMTALSETEHKVRGFAVGAVDYVTKPVQMEEVVARVSTHLQLRDLTQRLQKSNEALAKANDDKDKFFSIVAHDLRSPFNPLLALAQTLSAAIDTYELREIKEISSSIYRSAQTVYTLLENLLDWSRLQMGHLQYTPTSIGLPYLADQVLQSFKAMADEKEIVLTHSIADDISLYTDANMLRIVLHNLVSNALKFTCPGGTIAISAVEANGTNMVEISVADTGVGMSRLQQEKLFRMGAHHSSLGTAQEKGTGLGLVICREMIDRCGGQIWVESVEDQGTTVNFTLPGSAHDRQSRKPQAPKETETAADSAVAVGH